MDHCSQFGRVALVIVGLLVTCADVWAQAAEPVPQTPAAQSPEAEPAALSPEAAAAKALFDQRFKEYQESLKSIEKLRTDYQTAGASGQKTINFQLQEKLAAAKEQLDAMVAAGLECYRLAPQDNPQLGQMLTAVAKHYTVGEASRQQKDAINGGDNYERALPIIKLLEESKVDEKRLPLWGFLAAFADNDYDLAESYLKQAQANGILAEAASMKDPVDQAAAGMVMQYAGLLPHYRDLWAKEQQIRAAEAAANDLPRVKFETSKGNIVIELFENEAPQATANFITLVKSGFYDGVVFHRVLPQFMAQGAIPRVTVLAGRAIRSVVNVTVPTIVITFAVVSAWPMRGATPAARSSF